MTYSLFYFVPLDTAYTVAELESELFIKYTANTANEFLNRMKIYPVNETPDPYNPLLYTTVATYTINGTEVDQSWTPTARPLATAKSNGKTSERNRASESVKKFTETSGYQSDALTAIASQLVADRGADAQTIISLQQGAMDRLDTALTAIDSATSVADVATVVDAPDLVFNTGRGVASEFDMNPCHFPTINVNGVTEAELELYIPAADVILPYRTDLPFPYHFDMGAALFTENDQRVVIRIAATGVVLGEVICPDTGSGPNVDIDVFTGQEVTGPGSGS